MSEIPSPHMISQPIYEVRDRNSLCKKGKVVKD
jgi:hypothetical protein